jgi:hypothetical protein
MEGNSWRKTLELNGLQLDFRRSVHGEELLEKDVWIELPGCVSLELKPLQD